MSRLSFSDNIIIIGGISLFVHVVLVYLAKLPETDSPVLKDIPTYTLIIGIVMVAGGILYKINKSRKPSDFTGVTSRHT